MSHPAGRLASMTLVAVVYGCQTPDKVEEPESSPTIAEYRALSHELEVAKATNSPMRIQPSIGVGPIKFGMTSEEVRAAVGDPYRRSGQAYEYQKLGLAVMLDGRDRVQAILCGAWCEPSDILLDVFKGTTDEGLALRASRADVVAIYGEPLSLDTLATGFEVLRYESMTLAVRDGRLVHMTFTAPRGR